MPAFWRAALIRGAEIGVGLGLTTNLIAQAAPVGPSTTVFVATVADALTGSPLPGVEVSIPGLNRSAMTDWLGEARITGIPHGAYSVSVRRVGYVPAAVSIRFAGDTVGEFFALGAIPPTLDTVTTRAAQETPAYLHDFEMRQRMGIGRFLTDSVLKAEKRTPIAQVMARRFPGFRVLGNDNGVGKDNCGVPDLYVDGNKSVADLSIVTAEDVAGVEFYTRASAPVQYRLSTTRCGVLLIWLKR
jgi:hypothetical protein